jgi:hypothetical protein
MTDSDKPAGSAPFRSWTSMLTPGPAAAPDEVAEVAEVVDGEVLPTCKARGCSITPRTQQALCDLHGSEQAVLAAKRRLAAAAPQAAEWLIDLAENGATEETRRRAMDSILDRAGVRGGVEVDVTSGQHRVAPAEVLRERLAILAARTADSHS